MTADIELLPLPEADDSVENRAQWPIVIDSDVWLQKSVQDYARACVAHAAEPLKAEIERLREDSARLDWLSKLDVGICHLGYGDYRWYTYANPVPEHGMLGLREAIDAAREDRNG